MHTSFIMRWLILCKSALITACYSTILIVQHARNQLSRTHIDTKLKQWAQNMLYAADVRYRVFNPSQVKPDPKKPTIIMSNHTSIYDIPISYMAFPESSIRMLAKKELTKIPFLGSAMRAGGFPWIDRQNQKQARLDLHHVETLLKNGIIVWIFPEGTRSADGLLKPLKKGAFITAIHADAQIIPVGIRGAHNILPARTTQLQAHQTVEIHIGEPVDTQKFGMSDRQKLIDTVSDQLKALSAS